MSVVCVCVCGFLLSRYLTAKYSFRKFREKWGGYSSPCPTYSIALDAKPTVYGKPLYKIIMKQGIDSSYLVFTWQLQQFKPNTLHMKNGTKEKLMSMQLCICYRVQVMIDSSQGDSGEDNDSAKEDSGEDNTMCLKCGIRYGDSSEKWTCRDGCGMWFSKSIKRRLPKVFCCMCYTDVDSCIIHTI